MPVSIQTQGSGLKENQADSIRNKGFSQSEYMLKHIMVHFQAKCFLVHPS